VSAASADAAEPGAYEALLKLWPKLREPLLNALGRRAKDRAESLAKKLDAKRDQEKEAITTALTELKAQIESELKEPEPEQLALFSSDEREQLSRDIEALRHRAARIPQDIEDETAAIDRRYAGPEPRLFPAAVTFLVPEGWKP